MTCTLWSPIFGMKAVCFPSFIAASRAHKYHFFNCLLNAFDTLELLRTGRLCWTVALVSCRHSTAPKRAQTHLDMNATAMEPIFAVVALDHECVVILAVANAVRLECLRQSTHKFTVREVNFQVFCLLFQVLQYLWRPKRTDTQKLP